MFLIFYGLFELKYNVTNSFFQGGPEQHGIFVKSLMPDGPALQSSRIVPGDRVHDINGVSLDSSTTAAKVTLHNASKEMVWRCYFFAPDPDYYLTLKFLKKFLNTGTGSKEQIGEE